MSVCVKCKKDHTGKCKPSKKGLWSREKPKKIVWPPPKARDDEGS